MSKTLPSKPCLEQLKNQAKTLLHACQAGDAAALARMYEHLPRLGAATEAELRQAEVCLKEAQHVIAREHGFATWEWLRVVVEADLVLLTRITDREMQSLLHAVDQKDLVVALTGAGAAVREKILGNLSLRARTFIEQEIDFLKLSTEQNQGWIDEVRRRVLHQAAHMSAQGQISWPDGSAAEPSAPVRVADPALLQAVRRPLEGMRLEELTDLAWAIAEQARRDGILSLEPVAEACISPYLSNGLRLAVDGTEPELIADILETRWQGALEPGLLARGRMIIEGILAISQGDNPRIVLYKLLVFRYEEAGEVIPGEPVPAADLAARLRLTSVARMSLDDLAILFSQMAYLARRESLDALVPLAAATDSSLLQLGLELLGSGTEPDAMIRQLEAHMNHELQQLGVRHRMVSVALRALQESKTPDEVRAAVGVVAGGG